MISHPYLAGRGQAGAVRAGDANGRADRGLATSRVGGREGRRTASIPGRGCFERAGDKYGVRVLEHVRIDKWLWAARFLKTRGAATEAVVGGHVRVNGVRAKPAKEVRVGDRVEIRLGEIQWTVLVTGVAERRGPASVAATLYEETAESIAGRERNAAERRLARPPSGIGGRPTKQARRQIEALRRAQRGYRSSG
jgi:ribosome-associated heat shock protein Hsp15